jgi:hypothetical protein
VESGELWNNGPKVRLAPKPARVLALLAGAPGKLVFREAIEATVWESGTFVDFEHGLNFCIREIRAALGDNAQRPRFVKRCRAAAIASSPAHPKPQGGKVPRRPPKHSELKLTSITCVPGKTSTSWTGAR